MQLHALNWGCRIPKAGNGRETNWAANERPLGGIFLR